MLNIANCQCSNYARDHERKQTDNNINDFRENGLDLTIAKTAILPIGAQTRRVRPKAHVDVTLQEILCSTFIRLNP